MSERKLPYIATALVGTAVFAASWIHYSTPNEEWGVSRIGDAIGMNRNAKPKRVGNEISWSDDKVSYRLVVSGGGEESPFVAVLDIANLTNEPIRVPIPGVYPNLGWGNVNNIVVRNDLKKELVQPEGRNSRVRDYKAFLTDINPGEMISRIYDLENTFPDLSNPGEYLVSIPRIRTDNIETDKVGRKQRRTTVEFEGTASLAPISLLRTKKRAVESASQVAPYDSIQKWSDNEMRFEAELTESGDSTGFTTLSITVTNTSTEPIVVPIPAVSDPRQEFREFRSWGFTDRRTGRLGTLSPQATHTIRVPLEMYLPQYSVAGTHVVELSNDLRWGKIRRSKRDVASIWVREVPKVRLSFTRSTELDIPIAMLQVRKDVERNPEIIDNLLRKVRSGDVLEMLEASARLGELREPRAIEPILALEKEFDGDSETLNRIDRMTPRNRIRNVLLRIGYRNWEWNDAEGRSQLIEAFPTFVSDESVEFRTRNGDTKIVSVAQLKREYRGALENWREGGAAVTTFARRSISESRETQQRIAELARISKEIDAAPTPRADLFLARAKLFKFPDTEKTAADLKKALELDPGSSEALISLAEIGEMTPRLRKDDDVMMLNLDAALKSSPDDRAIRTRAARLLINRARQYYLPCRDGGSGLCGEAGSKHRADTLLLSENLLRRAVELDQELCSAYGVLGGVAKLRGELQTALRAYDREVDCEQTSGVKEGRVFDDEGSSLSRRADIHKKLGNLKEAIGDLTKAIELNLSDPSLWVKRGRLKEEANDLEGALADFEEAILRRALDCDTDYCDYQNSHLYHARARARLQLKQYASAIADYETVVANSPSETRLQLGMARLLATYPDDAVRDGKRALSLALQVCRFEDDWPCTSYLHSGTRPQNSTPEHHLSDTIAAIYAELGDFEKAIHWQTKALPYAGKVGLKEAEDRLALYQKHMPYRDSKHELMDFFESKKR